MDEVDTTLDEVLAFVDAFAAPVDAQEGDEDAQEQLEAVKKVSESSDSDGRDRKRAEAKRRRVETKYTTNLQRRKRAELSDLREQAAMLGAQLDQLQRVRGSHSARNSGVKARTALEERAVRELEARRRTEKENRELWSRLERQAKLRGEIARLIDKFQRQGGSISDERSVFAAKMSSAIAGSGISAFGTAMTTLVPTSFFGVCLPVATVLEHLVSQVDSVFANSFLRPRSCWLEANQVGNTREVWSCTTAESSVSTAADALWSKSSRMQHCLPLGTTAVYIDDGCYSFEKFLLPIQCRPWETRSKEICSSVEVALHVEHYSRRVYDQATGRAVQVILALIRLSSDDDKVLLREHFWKYITPTNSSAATGSVTQTSYRIEPADGNSNKVTPIQESIMSTLAQHTRRNQAAYQDWLLQA